MRVSLNWLKEYVQIDVEPRALADGLTMAGLEVEAMEPLGHALDKVVAARIVSVERHSRADKLFVCHVDTGEREVQVISSAPNLAPGAVVPIALPGTRLPDGRVVKETKMVGEPSVGMLLAEDEMGLTDDHSGIMILPSVLAPGTPVASALNLKDWALDIALTPNRPDCASVLGIAREISAVTGQRLNKPEIKIEESTSPIETLTSVTIEDPLGCPRYAAGMIMGVELKPSPFWMRYRLHVSGIRSINNIVDVTNYVLLELGQPLHAFDYDRLKENRIVVRRAKRGERFTTLDGKTHTLSTNILMICDGKRPVALAGIMGGLNSEIFAGSKNVLIESAYFDPLTVRKGAKELGISTEASYRFERGVDFDGVIRALQRALMLISKLAGGKIAKGYIDEYPRRLETPSIDLRIDRTNRFLGTSISREKIAGFLQALEMQTGELEENLLRVKPPSFRVDLTREIDLIEEVARLEGYEKIPVTYPAIKPSEEGDAPEISVAERIAEIMVGFGFTEVISYSFISPTSADMLGVEKQSELRSFVKLLNPLSTEQSVMRTSLIPGLLASVKTNFSYGERSLKIFEVGKVFISQGAEKLPVEKRFLTALVTGLYEHKSWYGGERFADFYDIKGVAEGLLKAFGLDNFFFRADETTPWYRPGACSSIYVEGKVVGTVGQLSSLTLKRLEIDQDVFILEIDLASILDKARYARRFKPFAKFPGVVRDLSVVVGRDIQSARIEDIIKAEGGELVESAKLFDLYAGGKISSSEKALTFRICYRSRERTLDGREVNKLHEAIINKVCQQTGARLREA